MKIKINPEFLQLYPGINNNCEIKINYKAEVDYFTLDGHIINAAHCEIIPEEPKKPPIHHYRLISSNSTLGYECIDERVETAEESAIEIREFILRKAKRDKMLGEIYTHSYIDDLFKLAIRSLIDSESKDGKISFCVSAHYKENAAGKFLVTEIRTDSIPDKTVLVERI